MVISAEIATLFKSVQSSHIAELVESMDLDVSKGIIADGKRLPWDKFKQSNPSWRVSLESIDCDWQISLTAIRKYSITLIQLDGLTDKTEAACELVMNMKGAFQARAFDKEYDTIQNLTDVNEYRDFGINIDNHLLVSNGLPPPLTAMVVDTSQNPGRRVLRDGFIECVGHQMWFADVLFEKLQLELRHLSALGLIRKKPFGFQLCFSTIPFGFKTPRKILDDIRQLLFHNERF